MDLTTHIASSTELGGAVGSAIFEGGFDALEVALPYMIAFAIFWFLYALVKRLIGGT